MDVAERRLESDPPTSADRIVHLSINSFHTTQDRNDIFLTYLWAPITGGKLRTKTNVHYGAKRVTSITNILFSFRNR